jgi:hypothetical protein
MKEEPARQISRNITSEREMPLSLIFVRVCMVYLSHEGLEEENGTENIITYNYT